MAVWDESKHPRDLDGKFTEKKARIAWAIGQSVADLRSSLVTELPTNLPDSIPLPDEWIPRSVGAKWRNYTIYIDHRPYHFLEGSHIKNKQVFAGKGTSKPIYDAAKLCIKYHEEHAHPGDWKKCKGIATLVDEYGKTMEAEIHWYEANSSEKYDIKCKTE